MSLILLATLVLASTLLVQTTDDQKAVAATSPAFVGQPIKLTVAESGTPATVNLSGCSVHPTSITANGATRTVLATPGCIITATLPSTSNTRYISSGGASSLSFKTCSSGTCPSFSATIYHQLLISVSYGVRGGGTPTAPTFHYYVRGVGTSMALTRTARTFWADAYRYSSTNPLTGSTTTQRWDSSKASGTISSAGSLVIPYYHQFLYVLSYSVTGGGTPNAPTLTSVRFGASYKPILSKTATGYWLDSATPCRVTNPTTGSNATVRWYTRTACPTVSAARTIVFAYNHQFYVTIAASGSGTVGPASGWNNAGSTITIRATPLTGYSFSRWTSSTASIKIANPGTATTTAMINGAGTSTATFTYTGTAASSWQSSTAIGTSGVYACVISGGHIFCVGGGSASGTNTYYATEGPNGIGNWSSGNAYPVSLDYPPACATDGTYVYCVGGTTSSAPVYSASISSSGFGTWTSQAPYPLKIELNTCVIQSGYIYCVTGYDNKGLTEATYYATVSSGAIGSWHATTAFPVSQYEAACVAVSNTIICSGGFLYTGTGSHWSFKATLSSSGIGPWSAASTMPTGMQLGSCVVASSRDYCMGGIGYTADLFLASPQNGMFFTSTSIFPNWQTDVPWLSVYIIPDMNGCASDGSYIFCVGGWTDSAFTTTTATTEYTAVSPLPNTIAWSSQRPIPGGGNGQTGGPNGIDASCGWSNGYTFCVQANGETWYASASSGTVGAWFRGTSYPLSFAVWPPTCVTDAGYIYCIGGADQTQVSDAVYSTSISASGFGTWLPQNAYPNVVAGLDCVVYSHYIYCVGGGTTFEDGYISDTYVASLSSGTVGAWNAGTSYPVVNFGAGCGVIGSTLYCVGGYSGGMSRVYTAALSTSSPYIGPWTHGTDYPVAQWDFNCLGVNGTLYCIGGFAQTGESSAQTNLVSSLVYSTPDGVTWTRQTNLPYSIASLAVGGCVADTSGYVYCIGGMLWTDDGSGPGYVYTDQVFSTAVP